MLASEASWGVDIVDRLRVAFVILVWGLFGACGEPIPADLLDYEASCVRMTAEEVPPYPEDPHNGFKHVYACHIDAELVGQPPYPDGTLILKTARKAEHSYPFLIATAQKSDGAWSWAEYTRNFEDQDYLKLPIAEQVCTDCHAAVADGLDWIFTGLEAGHD